MVHQPYYLLHLAYIVIVQWRCKFNYKIIYYSSFTHPKLTYFQNNMICHRRLHNLTINIISDLFLKLNRFNNNLFVRQVFNQPNCSDIEINFTCHSINHLSTTQHFHINNNFLLVHQIPLQPLPLTLICLQSNVIHAVLSTNNAFTGVQKSEWWQWSRRH